MRSNRSIRLGIGLIGGACALLLAYVLWHALRPAPAPLPVAQNTGANGVTPVSLDTGNKSAVALMDIPERSIITPGMFRMDDIPEDAPRSARLSYVTDPPNQSFGFITRKRILKDQRLLQSDLVGHISEVGIAGALRPGMMAISIPLTTKPTFHDIVRIGDFVDVLAAFDGQESRTIVDNVRVLAVDVFGKDYPQTTSVAQRGAYKAPWHSTRADVSPSMAQTSGKGEASVPLPTNTPAAAAPGATPAATPTPTATQPPPPAAPAITLEVTPDQANRIHLALSSNAPLEFLIRPIAQALIVPLLGGATPRLAAVNRAELAPYAESKKSAGAASRSGNNSGNNSGSHRSTRGHAVDVSDTEFSGPNLPPPANGPGLKPVNPDELSSDSYGIPIYADGTRKRVDVVRKPQE